MKIYVNEVNICLRKFCVWLYVEMESELYLEMV